MQQLNQQRIRSQLTSSLFGGFRIQPKINQMEKQNNTPKLAPISNEFDFPQNSKTMYQSPQLSLKPPMRSDPGQLNLRKTSSSFRSFKGDDTDDKHKSVKFEDKYRIEAGKKVLGQGAHAVVKRARRLIDGQIVAVKIVRSGDPEVISTFEDTFKNTNFLRHQGVVKTYEIFVDECTESLFLVMEYVHWPSLQSLLRLNPQNQFYNPQILRQEWLVRKIVQQLTSVILHIHERGVCHRDIKPDNILVNIAQQNEEEPNSPATTEVQVKLIDFGVSKRFKQFQHGKLDILPKKVEMWTCTGNQFYCAPEVFEGGWYDEKIDVWALGVITYQLLTGKLPFQADTVLDTIELIRTQEINFTELKISNLCQDFLRRVLQKDPKKRVTGQEMSQHPWLYIQKEVHFTRRKLIHRQSTYLLEEHKQESLVAKLNTNVVLSSNENVVRQPQNTPKKIETSKNALLQYLDEAIDNESDSPLIKLSKIRHSIHIQKKPDQELGEGFLNNPLVNRIRMLQQNNTNNEDSDSDIECDASDKQ